MGQGGYITSKNEAACRFFTAQHNIAVEDLKTLAIRVRPFTFRPVTAYELSDFNFLPRVPRMLRDGITWKKGLDVAWDKTVNEGEEAMEIAFDRVRDDFRYEVGQKVGMAIFTTGMLLSPETTKSYPGEFDLKSIYGTQGGVKVYTGAITSVGDDFIEYDVNTALGFSGAVVFLLDRNQPQSVRPTDYGAAVAIHAGNPNSFLFSNFGFLLRSHELER